jgi:hypothetical protein
MKNVSLSITHNLFFLAMFTYAFPGEVMNWAGLKYPNLCLPKASA